MTVRKIVGNTVGTPIDPRKLAEKLASVAPTAINLSALDTEGRIVETYADGSTKTTVMEFDADGNPVKITDGDGNVTVLTW
jgi:hypothetical protein